MYDASSLAAASYTWTQTVTAGQATFAVAVPTTALEPGDTVFVQLGTDPNDSGEPNWAEVCQVTANTGSTVTVNVPVPYAISQGSRTDSLQRLTDVVQNVTFGDVNFNYVSGTTPDTDLWLNMARNVTVSNLTGQFTIGANVTDSQNVTVDRVQRHAEPARLVRRPARDGLPDGRPGDHQLHGHDGRRRVGRVPGELGPGHDRHRPDRQLERHVPRPPRTCSTSRATATARSSAARRSNNVGAVNLVESGSQAASYSFWAR